ASTLPLHDALPIWPAAAAEIRAMAAAARAVVCGCTAHRLRIGVDAVGHRFRALLRAGRDGHHERADDGREEHRGASHRPGCGGLTGSHATTPARFVSRRNSLPPCVTYSHARPGPPKAMLVIGVAVNSGLFRMFVHRPGCSHTCI